MRTPTLEAKSRPATASSADPAERYRAIRKTTERLCSPLSPEDSVVQSMRDASPAKWHLAHTSWFFETMLLKSELDGYRPLRPEFEVLFNSYYNSVGRQHPRPERGLLTRPSLDEILDYRRHVDTHMDELFASGRMNEEQMAGLLETGLQHEQQHQELILMDVKHLFSCNPLRPAYRERADSPSAAIPKHSFHRHEDGLRSVGHPGDGFGYDNEGPRHEVFVRGFEIGSRLVTNAEYLEFIEDNGYRRPELWLSDGWDALGKSGWTGPLYWEERDGERLVMTLAGLKELQRDEPVCHVSYYEADAYARWAGARLPGEAEWEIAARDLPREGNFMENDLLHPAPAPANESGDPVQFFGDVWEWTASPYVPYPGYRPPAGTLSEYNAKFMCNQLVLRGGACVTPREHIRATYRNFFYPDSRWQFSGIRLAR